MDKVQKNNFTYYKEIALLINAIEDSSDYDGS
jgi:hypothetical protein